MKKVEFNEEDLGFEEINKVVNKVRAFVVNKKTGKVLLVHYAELYMLPGGSIDKEEDVLAALEREIVEESGIVIREEDAVPFLEIDSYDKNYFDRKNGFINRLTKTIFFEVITDQDIDADKKKLTESEKEAGHSIFYVQLGEMNDLIQNNQTTNPKRKQFDREILVALSEYLEFKKMELGIVKDGKILVKR